MLPPGSPEVLSCGSLWAFRNYGSPNPSFLAFEWTVPASSKNTPGRLSHERAYPRPGAGASLEARADRGHVQRVGGASASALLQGSRASGGWPSTGVHCHLRLYHRGSQSQASQLCPSELSVPGGGMVTGSHSIPDRSPLLLPTAQLPSCPNTTHLLSQMGSLPLYFLDCQGTCQVLRGPREQREYLIHTHTRI